MPCISGFWHWSVNKHNLLNFSKNVITRVPVCHSPVNVSEPGKTLGADHCGQFESDCSWHLPKAVESKMFLVITVHILRSEHLSHGIQASQNACSKETKLHAIRPTMHIHSQAHSEQYTALTHNTRHAATAPTQRNDVNNWVFLNYNFSKEQCTLPEDDHTIETCWDKSLIINIR
jgi:hypothetical protein